MRLVIQRVKSASVTINDGATITGSIAHGLCVLVGVCNTDTDDDVEFCVRRLLRMKLFPKALDAGIEDGSQQWGATATEHKLGVLLVSQFTLHAKFKKPKPDFHAAMAPAPARQLFQDFVTRVRKEHNDKTNKNERNAGRELTQTGVFGEHMSLTLENDGPVTMIVDSEMENGARKPARTSGVAPLGENTGARAPMKVAVGNCANGAMNGVANGIRNGPEGAGGEEP